MYEYVYSIYSIVANFALCIEWVLIEEEQKKKRLVKISIWCLHAGHDCHNLGSWHTITMLSLVRGVSSTTYNSTHLDKPSITFRVVKWWISSRLTYWPNRPILEHSHLEAHSRSHLWNIPKITPNALNARMGIIVRTGVAPWLVLYSYKYRPGIHHKQLSNSLLLKLYKILI